MKAVLWLHRYDPRFPSTHPNTFAPRVQANKTAAYLEKELGDHVCPLLAGELDPVVCRCVREEDAV